jgi:outer membrane protein assembly factor BamB
VSHGGKMVAIDSNGTRKWQCEIGGLYPPVLTKDWLFILSSYGEVLCLQRSTGLVRWVVDLPQPDTNKNSIYWSGPLIANNELVFVGSNGQVQFLSTADGHPTKTLKYSGESYLPPVIVDNTLYVLTNQAELYAWR